MKKLLLFALLFTGCESAETTLSKMKSPVVIIGLTKCDSDATVSVRDAAGRVEVFGNCGLSQSLRNNHIGDTLK